MKTRTFIAGTALIQLIAGLSLQAADQMTSLHARSGSKMRIEGTSVIHDWQVESRIIGGSIEVGPNFPTVVGQEVKPGKVDIHGIAIIRVRSLQSVEKNGTHFSDTMDNTMWTKLKMNEYTNILYYPSELSLKEPPKSKDSPYVFDSKGDVVVAGVTNTVSMPVNIMPIAGDKVKISGTLNTKFSSFKIEPVYLIPGGKTFKTADDVKLIFEWVVGPKPTAAASTK